jgi:hypothetical protein
MLKATVAACAVSAAAAGTLFATQAGAAPLDITPKPDSAKQIQVYVTPDVRCFSVTVDGKSEGIWGNRFAPRPKHGIKDDNDQNFAFWNFDSDAVARQGGKWERTSMFARPGSTVEVWTSAIGCGHLVAGDRFEQTDWKVPNDSLHNVWVDTRVSAGP